MASEFLISWGSCRLLGYLQIAVPAFLNTVQVADSFCFSLPEWGLVSTVDIDQPSLDLVSAQARAMGLDVKCECALFGEGFSDQKFDRIIFFEAFHHAWDFDNLLDRLAGRLKPGGRLILCGEPVVQGSTPGVPFPWGPRLDGLSVFCMRHFGWMELGFSRDFLFQAFHRHGWKVSEKAIAGFGRATVYVATRSERSQSTAAEIAGPTILPWRTFTFSKKLAAVARNPRLIARKIKRILGATP
jgi:SAM-dependent methyltransferase